MIPFFWRPLAHRVTCLAAPVFLIWMSLAVPSRAAAEVQLAGAVWEAAVDNRGERQLRLFHENHDGPSEAGFHVGLGLGILIGLAMAASLCAMVVWRYLSVKKVNAALVKGLDDLRQAEDRLSLAHAEVEQAFETAGTGMRVVNSDFLITRINGAYADLTGMSGIEMLGRPCHESFPGPACHTPSCTLRRILAGEERIEEEAEKVRPEGTRVPCLLIATPFRNLDGRVVGMVESFHDLTKRKAYEKLREDVELIMRHDLKSPLTGMIGCIKLMIDEKYLEGEGVRLAMDVIETGYRLLHMINLSLDIYKMETGTYCLDARPVDLIQIMKRVQAATVQQFSGKGVTTSVTIEGASSEGRAFMAFGEETLLYSMLTNLVANAVQASPPRADVSIDLDSIPNWLRIRIRNQGEVPQDIRARLFEKYATSGKVGGTGLGAYSARLIAEAHGGKAEFDCSVAGETTITICLPPGPWMPPAAGGDARE